LAEQEIVLDQIGCRDADRDAAHDGTSEQEVPRHRPTTRAVGLRERLERKNLGRSKGHKLLVRELLRIRGDPALRGRGPGSFQIHRSHSLAKIMGAEPKETRADPAFVSPRSIALPRYRLPQLNNLRLKYVGAWLNQKMGRQAERCG